ncbi:hypothetical protein [Sphingobium yanoikuyae]|uniref:hypothetical protein n=1 Tax=Sphingobium yanoikuyae TaxID=13690 RepID=UPI0035C69545
MGRRIDKEGWAQSLAARIGMGGTIDFTPARVGQTLHLPCAGGGGHKVDVRIGPNQHPDAVAKKLLAEGWSLGNKLRCPRHTRKGVKAALGNGTAFDREGSLSAPESLPQGVELPPPAVAVKPLTPQEAGRLRWKGLSKEERREAMAKVQAAKTEKREGNKEMASAVVAENNAANMSSDAKRAHRLVIAALEDYYDERSNSYRKDYSDKRIAEELNISESSVAKTREDFFGPLAASTPIEVQLMADSIKSMRVAVNEAHKAAMAAVEAQEDKLEALCRAKGWTVV